MGVMPFSGIQFFVFDATHTYLKATLRGSPYAKTSAAFVAGASAGVVATVLTYPLDVLRARQAVGFNYRNYPTAVEEIILREGLRGLWKGLTPTLLGMLPYGAISFSTFDALKRQLRQQHGVACDAEVPLVQRLAAGGLSGAAAQVAAYPLHIVRRRMQVHASQEIGATGSLAYANTRDALLQISRNEGVINGLFKSLSLTWLKGPMTVGLAFVTNDVLKSSLRVHYSRRDNDEFVPLPGQGHVATQEESSARSLHPVEGLVCGGVAGAIAKTVIAPGDRVKIIFQTDPTRHFTWSAAWQMGCRITSEQGVRGLWRGHVATLLRVAPYSATSFAVFDPYKALLRARAPDLDPVYTRFLAGAAAGTTATTLTYPFDLFRARMAASGGVESPYDGYLRAAIQVVRTEGPQALFSGLRPTLLGIVPYSGISFCMFETLKARLKASQDPSSRSDLSSGKRLAAGALSGLVAQSATYPLDIVRRRMQVSPDVYKSELQAFASIVRAEGLPGLYKGLSMNWVKGPVAVGISFTINDSLREFVAGR